MKKILSLILAAAVVLAVTAGISAKDLAVLPQPDDRRRRLHLGGRVGRARVFRRQGDLLGKKRDLWLGFLAEHNRCCGTVL